ncbi:MAG: SGNH/GDSL hydrolase family protein [Tepidisphaeraceae bacterium]
MKLRLPLICALLIVSTGALSSADDTARPFELRDGDRVALVGGTFIEREQNYSYLETLLLTRWPDRKITFRNLGWSGDTVLGHARGYFDGAEQGFARLNAIVHELKPTVIFLGYGMGESFDGEAGLPAFRAGLERMLDMLKDLDARTVLIGPIRHETLGPPPLSPLPDPAEHNRLLRLYADAMKDVANQRGHRFVDLYELLQPEGGHRLTDNGIHLTAYGYHRAAAVIAGAPCTPLSPVQEKIRQLSIQKNIQYFNQWRPANEPYIFGFRKHEQSRNRLEMPRFTPPIEKLEEEIRKLCQLIDVTSDLTPAAKP